MNDRVHDIERLSALLLKIEDRYAWDAATDLIRARELEQEASALGDELLIARARLCQVNMRLRSGDVAGAARRIWRIHQWAADHDARQLLARTHLIWASIHQILGDAEQCLEHAVLSVEMLDDTATAHMQVWHRVKLADALGVTGSMDAARVRYAQAEELARGLGQTSLMLSLLNNYAYAEYAYGSLQRAEEIIGRAVNFATAHGQTLDPALLDTIAVIQIENGRFAEAEAALNECIDRHSEGRHDDADALAHYLLTLARTQRGLGAYQRAQGNLDASRALCVQRDLGDVLVRVHQEQAELHAARGEYAEAFAVHKVFFAAYNSLHSLQREARARTRHAMFETAEARQEAERFREQARRDPLTGLHNRRYVDEQLPGLIDTDPGLTVALVDLDHFKQINDRLSHDVGDRVLVRVAELLTDGLAGCAGGFVARMGGEEFLVVMPDTTVPRAVALLERLRLSIRGQHWQPLTHGLPVTVSIGVAALAEADTPTQPGLLSTADRHLYAAKHGGRDQVVSTADFDDYLAPASAA